MAKSGNLTSSAVTAKGGDAGRLNWLSVLGAAHNNLKDIDVHIPLGRFVCVTGVSGSGKSSLVNDILREQLAHDLNEAVNVSPGKHETIRGKEQLDKVIDIDQSPIGRTPRSNPATYIKLFDDIRDLFTKLPDSKVRGYKKGRFSFNVPSIGETLMPAAPIEDEGPRDAEDERQSDGAMERRREEEEENADTLDDESPPAPPLQGGEKYAASTGGRCEVCQGNGATRVEMDFLADIWVTCPVCEGRRFNRETLAVRFRGKSIADVLDMDVQQAIVHFANIPQIAAKLQTLHDVGLDYLKLGQSSTTLSGGEAQRIKLARELVRRSTGRTLYLLDEPTTGLHFEDVRRLLAVLHGFVDAGNTVIVIEHHLDVIKTADWVIDLGPEGGEAGGYLVAEGTPEAVAANERSYTGQALRSVLTPVGWVVPNPPVGSRQSGAVRGDRQADARRRKAGGSSTTHPTTAPAIRVVNAREHNLQGVSVDIPRNAMTICSGVSGSGKSSFAIDTVYTEGHRRYVESLSAYARQFLGQLQKPAVDHVYGLSPAIAIEQGAASKSPRSTVGTVTEIYDYMRVLWARLATPYCPRCNVPIGTQSADEIVERVAALPEGSRVLLCAPVERGVGEGYADLFARHKSSGFMRVRVDGTVYALDEPIPADDRRRHSVQIVVDRLVMRPGAKGRLADSVEQCLSVGQGVMLAILLESEAAHAEPLTTARELRFSQRFSCDVCNTAYEELTPHHFSFNSRLGWCPACEGLGVQRGTRTDSIVLHPSRSILDGALNGFDQVKDRPLLRTLLEALAKHIGFDAATPWCDLAEEQRHKLLFGTGDAWIESGNVETSKRRNVETDNPQSSPSLRFQFKGFFPAIDEATRVSWQYRFRLDELITEVPCQKCASGRLRPEPAAARLGTDCFNPQSPPGLTIGDACNLPLSAAYEFFAKLDLDRRQKKIAGELLREITARMKFLLDVGLDYLSLSRGAPTLSGGEAQRIRLASQIGSGLTGVLYVLDEPTIGLHPRDNARLIATLHRLRDLGNTLLVVEHDREVIQSADHVLDFGPGAGRLGGRLVGNAAPANLPSQPESLTGAYLANREAIPVPTNRRADTARLANNPQSLTLVAARCNNLKNLTVEFPLHRFICITGVSGSGKSSLITDTLYPALAQRIHRATLTPGPFGELRGLQFLDKVINVDQAAIGASPLSNPATYTGVFDHVRDLFAKLPDSKVRGYTPNRFSFNRPGGRCEACEGLGQVRHEMHFLPDVWTTCDTCGGDRYNPETLDVRYKARSIADVLRMSVAEALAQFENIPKIKRLLQTLADVGLDYMPLGQSSTTLSGGEAQRVKLAAELARPATGRTIYILDEPTTGLHLHDTRKLLDVLHRLVDLGNTVLCIEHNLDVIKTADWLIDLGPEAGDAGGEIVAEGTPEAVVRSDNSHTARALTSVLAAGPFAERTRFDPKAAAGIALARADEGTLELAGSTDAQMPWQVNGRRWHTRERPSRNGEKVEWSGDVLEFVIQQVEELGGNALAPADWNDRARVEIRASARGASSLQWFLHVATGGKWLLELAFRVPTGTFTQTGLVKQLGLKTLDQRGDLPVYGNEPRVNLRPTQGGWDAIRILVHDLPEMASPGFGKFLAAAVDAYLKRIAHYAVDESAARPWEADGRAWHLGQKAMPPGVVPAWTPAMLIELLGRINRALPRVRPDYNRKAHIGLMLGDREIGRVWTGTREGLGVNIFAPPGRVAVSQIMSLGHEPRLERGVGGKPDIIVFTLRTGDLVPAEALAELLRAAIDS